MAAAGTRFRSRPPGPDGRGTADRNQNRHWQCAIPVTGAPNMARYRRNLLTVGWVTVVLGALHLADHAGVVLSAFGLCSGTAI
jgi:hypothetical protein